MNYRVSLLVVLGLIICPNVYAVGNKIGVQGEERSFLAELLEFGNQIGESRKLPRHGSSCGDLTMGIGVGHISLSQHVHSIIQASGDIIRDPALNSLYMPLHQASMYLREVYPSFYSSVWVSYSRCREYSLGIELGYQHKNLADSVNKVSFRCPMMLATLTRVCPLSKHFSLYIRGAIGLGDARVAGQYSTCAQVNASTDSISRCIVEGRGTFDGVRSSVWAYSSGAGISLSSGHYIWSVGMALFGTSPVKPDPTVAVSNRYEYNEPTRSVLLSKTQPLSFDKFDNWANVLVNFSVGRRI